MDGPGYETLSGDRFAPVGRVVLDLSSYKERQPWTAQLNPNKTVEVWSHFLAPEGSPWPATVSLNMSTLWLITRARSEYVPRSPSKGMLDLLPQKG
jgi:hypothetical protein